ncbi:MAG TPA: hypothetical protein VFW24_12950 [Acidimicrobiales bacterium]|nr:hypothetical protein [Acidimicrobiales bacterium]
MSDRPRTYRKKPFAVFEHGTRIYAPTRGELRWRVVAGDAEGTRVFHKVGTEDAARARARVIEADLARHAPLRPAEGPRTVRALSAAYLASLEGRSFRYRERQAAILSRWVLPHLGALEVGPGPRPTPSGF